MLRNSRFRFHFRSSLYPGACVRKSIAFSVFGLHSSLSNELACDCDLCLFVVPSYAGSGCQPHLIPCRQSVSPAGTQGNTRHHTTRQTGPADRILAFVRTEGYAATFMYLPALRGSPTGSPFRRNLSRNQPLFPNLSTWHPPIPAFQQNVWRILRNSLGFSFAAGSTSVQRSFHHHSPVRGNSPSPPNPRLNPCRSIIRKKLPLARLSPYPRITNFFPFLPTGQSFSVSKSHDRHYVYFLPFFSQASESYF